MVATSESNLKRFYDFFDSTGAERLAGLDHSYFVDLSSSEKEEAWNFLKDGFAGASERINGLYIFDPTQAVELFKQAIALPVGTSSYAAERQALESNRLLMLKYICNVEPDEKNIAEISKFADSQFPQVRAQMAQALPAAKITPPGVEALKKLIFTEVERIPLSSAISKFMLVHGMNYDMDDMEYKSLYLSLKSESPQDKLSAMRRLELIRRPDYY